MLSTRVIVFMIISALLGLFHFGVSRVSKLKDAKNDRDKLQIMIIRMWGKRGLIFSFIMIPVYFLRDDIFLYVVLIYLGLLGYNSFLLRKGISKLNDIYAASDKPIK
jgi:hypothetical protein